LDGPARGARDDDAPSADADPRADGRQEEREAFLAERPFEGRGHPGVVPHADAPRELDVTPRAIRVTLERLLFRQAEQRRHPLERDSPLHTSVAALDHRTAEPFVAH